MDFINTEPAMKICKVSPVSPNRRLVTNHAQF